MWWKFLMQYKHCYHEFQRNKKTEIFLIVVFFLSHFFRDDQMSSFPFPLIVKNTLYFIEYLYKDTFHKRLLDYEMKFIEINYCRNFVLLRI